MRPSARLCRALPAALLLATACERSPAAPPGPVDVTGSVERLGNPFGAVPTFARNVWDMQAFDGRIYVGHGDSGANAGPIAVWTIEPGTGQLVQEYETSEEQVDVFRVLGRDLYIPGHDPRDDLTLGNFYRRGAGEGWSKQRTIPDGLHTFDLALHGGRHFAALGSWAQPGFPTLVASDDAGRSWSPVTGEVRRFHSLFTLGGQLYAAPLLVAGRDGVSGVVDRFDGQRFVPTAWDGTHLLVGAAAGAAGRMLRATEHRGVLVYISARNDFFWEPLALATLRPDGAVSRLALPDPEALPYDLLVRGDELYLLAAAPAPVGFTLRVYATRDLVAWREVFHFTAPTFARSFEEHGGDWFFGLGTLSQRAPHASTGDLLRVPRASYRPR